MEDTNSSAVSGKLFEEFLPVTSGEWEEKIREDLYGADLEKRLIRDTGQGFPVRSFYRQEDTKDLGFMDAPPGEFPFTRAGRKQSNEWLVRQDIQVDDFETANKKALDILMRGVDSIGFILDENRSYEFDDLDRLYKNILAESIESNFLCGHASADILRIILELVRRYNRSLDKIRGSVDYDPLGELITSGWCSPSFDAAFDCCKQLIEIAEHLPHFQVITIHGDLFHHAGATIAHELGFSLAAGVEYLTQLTERQLSINKVAPRIRFQFATGSDYFMEIAKLRAARFLWAHIVKAYGPAHEAIGRMFIHTITSRWNMTIYDPHVNILRSATESMSSILSGTDSHTVIPFTTPAGLSDDFSERIARNQQLLLKEESYLDRVIDPAAGSYYVENLSSLLMEKAWELFLQVEEKGGFLQAFLSGFVQDQIRQVSKTRDAAISRRKEILIGTNQYPQFQEKIGKQLEDRYLYPESRKSAKAITEPLQLYRGAMPFEQLRYATDGFARKQTRPRVFMVTFGNLAMRRARAQFASNFFACAGFEIIDNIGFSSLIEGVKAAAMNKADVVVFCSSDEEYASIEGSHTEKLGKNVLAVVAGNPEGMMEKLREAGIAQFIHARSDVLGTLREVQRLMGVL